MYATPPHLLRREGERMEDACCSVNSSRLVWPPRRTCRCIGLPARSRLRTCQTAIFCVGCPSIFSMKSPRSMPAFAAGEPATGAMTNAYPKRFVTIRPTPLSSTSLKFLYAAICARRHVVAELVDGVGHAGERAVHQLIGRHLLDVVVLHQLEHLGEDAEVAVDVVLLRGLAEEGAAEEREKQRHGDGEECDFLFAHVVELATAAISADLQACCPAGSRSRGSRNARPPTRRLLQSSVQR